MELLYVGLVAAIAALNLIGGGVLIRWLVKQIRTLEGTVSAQGNTITAQGEALRAADQTYRSLNDLMNVLDLERWVKRPESHAKLVEAEGQVKIEAERRQFQVKLEAAEAKGLDAQTWQETANGYSSLALESTLCASARESGPDRSERAERGFKTALQGLGGEDGTRPESISNTAGTVGEASDPRTFLEMAKYIQGLRSIAMLAKEKGSNPRYPQAEVSSSWARTISAPRSASS